MMEDRRDCLEEGFRDLRASIDALLKEFPFLANTVYSDSEASMKDIERDDARLLEERAKVK